jgi:hypothetical protein
MRIIWNLDTVETVGLGMIVLSSLFSAAALAVVFAY